MKLLNFLSRVFARMMISLPSMQRSTECKYNIEKVDDKEFEKHRYDDSYSTIELDNGAKCVYKIYEEEKKVRTLYVLDVSPLNPRSFEEAIKRIYRTISESIDIIIYVGKLPFRATRLIKVPKLMEHREIRMTGKILMPEVVDDSVFAIENWNVNISNFDVR